MVFCTVLWGPDLGMNFSKYCVERKDLIPFQLLVQLQTQVSLPSVEQGSDIFVKHLAYPLVLMD